MQHHKTTPLTIITAVTPRLQHAQITQNALQPAAAPAGFGELSSIGADVPDDTWRRRFQSSLRAGFPAGLH